jgi:hypothetical protein
VIAYELSVSLFHIGRRRIFPSGSVSQGDGISVFISFCRRKRIIATIKVLVLTPFTIMLADQHYSDLFADAALPKHELFEIHRSKISLHHAKAGYSYPTIRLPYAFSKLAGLPTRIYQTVHEGALDFLVVVSPPNKAAEKSANKSENAIKSAKSLALT